MPRPHGRTEAGSAVRSKRSRNSSMHSPDPKAVLMTFQTAAAPGKRLSAEHGQPRSFEIPYNSFVLSYIRPETVVDTCFADHKPRVTEEARFSAWVRITFY